MASKSHTDSQEHSPPSRVRYTIEVTKANGAYHATEPASDSEIVGRGQTHPEAIANYVEVFRDER